MILSCERNVPPWTAALLALLLLALVPRPAQAQPLLRQVDEETGVKALSFRFLGRPSFEEDRLKQQIVTTAPGFWHRLKRWLPLLDAGPYPPFSPVELRKDYLRLRRFYERQGFLHPEIDYMASRLDTTSNLIHVIFAIAEGPPVILQDVSFLTPDDRYASYLFPPGLREAWTSFLSDEILVPRAGDRYTEFDRVRIRSQTLAWLQNQGFAFARVEAVADVDPVANTADLTFIVDPGPRAVFDDILVEGNDLVSDAAILRQLPFRPGDRFSNRKMTKAQQELFSLNLFRLALTSVPEQPRDETVDVAIRVREVQPRFLSSRVGYARENGLQIHGEWTNRNFLGGLQTFNVSATANTGFLSVPVAGMLPTRLFRTAFSIRQPYLFTRNLSGSISPFASFERDPQLEETGDFLDINSREIGVNTTLVYQIYPFRTVSLQHTYSRVLQRAVVRGALAEVAPEPEVARDPFGKSVLSMSAILGKVNSYVNPVDGILVKPFAEVAGALLGSEIDYVKLGAQASGYYPLSERTYLAGRLFAGRVWPTGFSRAALLGDATLRDSALYENRFDPVLFYLGGASDLRGYNRDLAGRKLARPLATDSSRFRFEPLGGLAKLAANVEVRMPFPGLGPSWRTAVFLDTGIVGTPPLAWADLTAGAGAGIRYQTVIGFIRLDLAYKLTPSFADLHDPETVYRYRRGLLDEVPEAGWLRRFNLHISIGQTF